MRGTDKQTAQMFSYLSPEAMAPQDHPLRVIRRLANAALDRLSPAFEKLYSATGRPSIPPEQLLRALLLQAFFSVRSERQLMEQLTYNMMFRWFVGLSMDAPVWDVTVFTKNRDRLLEGDIAHGFLQALLADPHTMACSLSTSAVSSATCASRCRVAVTASRSMLCSTPESSGRAVMSAAAGMRA